ncbi:hypothetical protein HYR99_00930 [Candidatus Poribacteria bacterium]|nr:hypothetical protein [Candidatus Poribacteria bacterium]
MRGRRDTAIIFPLTLTLSHTGGRGNEAKNSYNKEHDWRQTTRKPMLLFQLLFGWLLLRPAHNSAGEA